MIARYATDEDMSLLLRLTRDSFDMANLIYVAVQNHKRECDIIVVRGEKEKGESRMLGVLIAQDNEIIAINTRRGWYRRGVGRALWNFYSSRNPAEQSIMTDSFSEQFWSKMGFSVKVRFGSMVKMTFPRRD